MAGNPFSEQKPWNTVSKGYEQTTMNFLTPYSRTAIEKAQLTVHDTVLDLACGPGTLSRLIYSNVSKIVAVDFSEDMLTLLKGYIASNGIQNIETYLEDGQQLPFEDNGFDAAFSMFGLMFFPDRMKGFGEVYRTLKPGGKAVVASWAPLTESPVMQLMFGALRAAKPDLPQPETSIANLEDPTVFESELTRSGFSSVKIEKVRHDFAVHSPLQFWEDMTKGSAPIAMLQQTVDIPTWDDMTKRALSYLEKALPIGTTHLTSTAWMGQGVKLASK